METLESSRVCRLCGRQSGISINIFDKNESHVKKINAVLPIMVHEMDLLPKHMCHRCSYKLEEFHKFYVDCLKTDGDLKSQLSWMRKADATERVGVPMVHIENIRIKVEPPDYDAYDLNPVVASMNYINTVSSVTFPVNGVRADEGIAYAAYARCRCCCDKTDEIPGCDRLNGLEIGKTSTVSPGDRAKSVASRVDLKSPVVRNLRPRKGSVDYVGAKRKTSSTSNSKNKLKTPERSKTSGPGEKLPPSPVKSEESQGRILRPRKRAINYLESRCYSKSSSSDQKLQRNLDQYEVAKISNFAGGSTLSPVADLADSIKLEIKEERIDVAESISFAAASRWSSSDFVAKEEPPDDRFANAGEAGDRGSSDRPPGGAGVGAPRLKPFGAAPRGRSRSGKVTRSRATAIKFVPKYLRSQDLFLRNGKLRTFEDVDISDKRVQRNKTSRRSLPPSTKLWPKIKHYCEECDVSFPTNEIFKLHPCYH